MLGNGGLSHPERRNHRADGHGTTVRKQFDDLPSPWLGDGVEDISGGGRSGHGRIIC